MDLFTEEISHGTAVLRGFKWNLCFTLSPGFCIFHMEISRTLLPYRYRNGDDSAIAAVCTGGICCRVALFSAITGRDYSEAGGRPFIQAITSDSRQPTARLPSLTGLGNSPAFIFRYNVDRLRPVSLRTSGSLSRRSLLGFMVCSSWISW